MKISLNEDSSSTSTECTNNTDITEEFLVSISDIPITDKGTTLQMFTNKCLTKPEKHLTNRNN